MKVFLDGQFFAEWAQSLDALALFGEIALDRLSLDPEKAAAFPEILNVAIEELMNSEAQALGYLGIDRAVSYADESSVPAFQADGVAFRHWRSAVWLRAYQLHDRINGRAVDSIDDFLAQLPPFVRPAQPD